MTAPLELPKLSAPAKRALDGAGITDLRQLDGRPEKEVLALHGLGPAQLGVLRSALAEHGLAMTDPVARPQPTGRNDLATRTTAVDPREWIFSLPKDRQVRDGLRLLEIFGAATGAEARMWGPSIVGYGDHHYVYDTGREGDTPQVAFSPRAAAISLYGLLGVPGGEEMLSRLGPHKRGKACLYVTSLARVDEAVLAELVRAGWEAPAGTTGC